MPSRKYSPMEPAQRQALERERSKRFYKPLFQIRKPGDAVGVFFMLAGCAALGWLAGVVILLLFYLLSLVLPAVSATDALTRPASVQLTMIASAALGMLGIPLWLHDRRRRAARCVPGLSRTASSMSSAGRKAVWRWRSAVMENRCPSSRTTTPTSPRRSAAFPATVRCSRRRLRRYRQASGSQKNLEPCVVAQRIGNSKPPVPTEGAVGRPGHHTTG